METSILSEEEGEEQKNNFISLIDLDCNSSFLVIVVSKRLYLPTAFLLDGWCNFNEWWPPNSKLIQTANGLR
jgi:hypothetical protein